MNPVGYSTWLWVGCVIGLLPGCAMLPPNSFLDPTAVGQFPLKYQEGGIRRVLTPREAPLGLANASEPTPEDLVPIYEEYRIGPNDGVAVSINDLLGLGQHEAAIHEVSPVGYIRLPILGPIKITGMTEQEVEEEIKARLIDEGILADPIVRVQVQNPRQRFFSVLGSANIQSVFPITQPDLRLLDALAMARGIGPNVKRLYVIRRTDRGEAEAGPPPSAAPAAEPTAEPPPAKELIIPPPTEEEDDAGFEAGFFGGLGAVSQEAPAEARQKTGEVGELVALIAPPGQPPQEAQEVEELEALIAPARPASQPAARPQQPEPERRFPPIVFDPVTGKPKQVDRAPEAEAPPPPGEAAVEELPPEFPEFEWEDVPEYELTQRVIEIDVDALKAGDPRYNIVMHDRDAVYVPVDTGVYYMMGEVARPGVYAFNDREITIKQAMAAAGGFTPMAWPQRCEIIRRERGSDTQITIPVNVDAIFAGLQDDVLLRDDDIINVGTHFVAPFLFVARNSFRFTYGFGFVYDRNFADKDAYGVKINPQTLKIQERQRRGLPF